MGASANASFGGSGDATTLNTVTVKGASIASIDTSTVDFGLNADAGGGTIDEASGKALYYAFQTAEKTYADFTLTARNPGGHSSQPRAANAIAQLARALERIDAYRFTPELNAITRGANIHDLEHAAPAGVVAATLAGRLEFVEGGDVGRSPAVVRLRVGRLPEGVRHDDRGGDRVGRSGGREVGRAGRRRVVLPAALAGRVAGHRHVSAPFRQA